MNTKENNSIPFQLRSERKRLKLTQEHVASCCQTTVQTVRRWEKKATMPAEKLSVLAYKGFDVQYILTGTRSANIAQVAEESSPYRVEQACDRQPSTLSSNDQVWLELGRQLTETDRTRLQEIAASLASAQEIKGKPDENDANEAK